MPLSRWSALPEGVLNSISAQLPSNAQQAPRLVCRSWRDNLAIQSVKSNQLNAQELHDICCKHSFIKRVDVSRSDMLTGRGIRPLSKLAGLTSLNMNYTHGYSLPGLEALTALRELDVGHITASPSAIEEVCKLTGLTKLDLAGENGFSLSLLDSCLASNLINLTNLQCLSLEGIRVIYRQDFRDILPAVVEDLLRQTLEALPRLTNANLGDIDMKGAALQAFQRHKVLQTLSVAGCQYLTDLTGLHGLPSMSSLNVHFTKINVQHPSLRCLPALRSLTIGDRITNAPLASIESLVATAPLDDISSLTMLRELVLVPHRVMLTQRICDVLLQLTQLKVLEFMTLSAYVNRYDWHLAPRLFTHPGLTRLSWTNMKKDTYRGEAGEVDNTMVPPHHGWRFEAYSFYRTGSHIHGEYLHRLFLDNIVCGRIEDFRGWVTSHETDQECFDMVFTRCAARQA